MTQPTLFESEEPSEYKIYRKVHSTKTAVQNELFNESDNLSPKQKRFLKQIEEAEGKIMQMLLDEYPGLKRYLS